MQTAGHRRLCVDRRLRVLRTALVGMGEGAHSGDYTDSDDHASVIPIAWALHGPFRLRLMLTSARQHVIVEVAPPEPLAVSGEIHGDLAQWEPRAAGWLKGDKLQALRAQETTTPGLLHADSLAVQACDSESADLQVTLVRGVDYEIDEQWGTVGWLPGGALASAAAKGPVSVSVTYMWTPLRLDSIVLRIDDSIELRMGKPYGAAPPLPLLNPGERRLMNIWLPGRIAQDGLTPASLFPVLEKATSLPPDLPLTRGSLRRTLEKLKSGQHVSIVAWGDSVTDGGYLPSQADRWQEQLARALRDMYPGATIDLRTEGWGGRSTSSYLAEPEGSERHFPTAILGDSSSPVDLVISEFVNDAGMEPELVASQYARIRDVFNAHACDWAILSPHYVRPGPVEGWMGHGFNQENGLGIEDDPRPYTAALREFVMNNQPSETTDIPGLALADAALLWGRHWRQGIPYSSLLLNSINHPNADGMQIFVTALLGLFK